MVCLDSRSLNFGLSVCVGGWGGGICALDSICEWADAIGPKTKLHWGNSILLIRDKLIGGGPGFFLLRVAGLPKMDEGRRRVRSLEY